MASVMRRMNTISRCETLYRTQQLDLQLPGIYHSYILAICHHRGMSQDKIAKHLCINKSNVTRHLAYLEENGYIERTVSPEDKREMLVYPKEKMIDLLPEVERITRKWNSLLAEGISEEELLVFYSVLDKMLEKSTQIIYSGEGTK